MGKEKKGKGKRTRKEKNSVAQKAERLEEGQEREKREQKVPQKGLSEKP